MSYKIAVASGKGGTGKTTLAVNLFNGLSKQLKGRVQLVDCDVEEPNDLIFFKNAQKESTQEITQLIPKIDADRCLYCRDCVEYCEFNAIVLLPTVKFATVNPNLCHSCGACLVACKHDVITEYEEPIGVVNQYLVEHENRVVEGRLKVGSAMQTMLIKALKENLQESDVTIYDAPPGTSCPVVETVCDMDYIVLVAEPTRFGLHDLKLMVALVKQFDIPFSVIINKAGVGDKKIYSYLEEEGISILGEIPFSRAYAARYAQGNITQEIPVEVEESYQKIISDIVLMSEKK